MFPNPNINQDFLNECFLLLIHVKNSKIKFLNNDLKTFCGCPIEKEINKDEFLQEIIHPDDYEDYKAHLFSFLHSSAKEEKIISLRVKSSEGNWSKICFKNRIYNWNKKADDPVVISVGYQVPELSFSYPPEKNTSASEQRIVEGYQLLFNSLEDGLSVIEMIYDEKNEPVDYLILKTNPALERQINRKNVEGNTIREMIPDYSKERLQNYNKVAVSGESEWFEFKAEEFDHSWLDFHVFKIGNKNSGRVAGILRNITKRKMAEEKLIAAKKELEKAKRELEKRAIRNQQDLLESEKLLQTVFDTTNQAIAVFETLYNEDGTIRDFKFLKVNKVLQEMYGENSPLGRSYLETAKYGVKMGIFDALKNVMRTGKSLDDEFYFDKEGYNHWFRFTARPQNKLLIAAIENITERKLESQELKENIRFKQQLIRTSPETIMIINMNSFSVRYINKDVLPEAGMTKEKVLGASLTDLIPFIYPKDREKVINFHRNLLKSAEDDVWDIEIRLKVKDTFWKWFSVRGKIFQRRDAAWVEEYVLLVRNITEQKKVQKALIKAENLSIQGEVARTLAHELRNPLASIRMTIDLLAKKLDEQDKQVKSYLGIQRRSTKTINNLVTNLLNSSNYSPAVLKKENLSDIINEALSRAADRIYLSGIKVVKNYKGPYYIFSDKEKLIIALLNLIVNASEATSPGEGLLEIGLKEKPTDFILSIKDNGHGLEPDHVDKLFEAFFTNKETGVGIGLNSVKSILEEHDATIDVWSKPNQGTRFDILLQKANIN